MVLFSPLCSQRVPCRLGQAVVEGGPEARLYQPSLRCPPALPSATAAHLGGCQQCSGTAGCKDGPRVEEEHVRSGPKRPQVHHFPEPSQRCLRSQAAAGRETFAARIWEISRQISVQVSSDWRFISSRDIISFQPGN